jgi:hypothetical protein
MSVRKIGSEVVAHYRARTMTHPIGLAFLRVPTTLRHSQVVVLQWRGLHFTHWWHASHFFTGECLHGGSASASSVVGKWSTAPAMPCISTRLVVTFIPRHNNVILIIIYFALTILIRLCMSLMIEVEGEP